MSDGFAASLAGQGLRLFEPRNASRVLVALLIVYTLGFLVFYPATLTVADEGTYVRQAQLMIQGSTAVGLVDPFTGQPTEIRPINGYPLGTALLLLPFVALGGREAACILALLCTLAGVGLTGLLLRDEGKSPLWAALVLAFPATSVMGRVAMSEAPSLMAVALGLVLYFRSLSRESVPLLFAAGAVAGASFAIRETNVLLFAPLFLGSAVRRDHGWPLLVLGGVLGLTVRALSAWMFFGDPFFTKTPADFSIASIAQSAPIYLFATLVLVPGGLITAGAYRGRRRPEIVVTVLGFVLFYMTYSYTAESSGWAKRLVLGPRYFIPLLPMLALTAADVWPRWAAAIRGRLAERTARTAETAIGVVCVAGVAALAVALLAVQFVHAEWAEDQARVREAIYRNTEDGSVIVTNWKATGKFIDLVGGKRVILRRESVGRVHVARLLETQGAFYVVFLDRSDAAFWRRNAMDNALFVGQLRASKELILDLRVTPTDRLRIWRVSDRSRGG